MPPDDDIEILIRKVDCVDFIQTPANEIWYDINPEDVNGWEWTPYTPEVWAELNRKMTIPWTKCSERMPPDGEKLILLRNVNERKYISKLYGFRLKSMRFIREKFEWAPYTEEAWAELNKK